MLFCRLGTVIKTLALTLVSGNCRGMRCAAAAEGEACFQKPLDHAEVHGAARKSHKNNEKQPET